MNTAAVDRQLFDRWAARYNVSPLQPLLFSPTHVAVVRAAAEAGAHPREILDVGCGTGRLLERAAHQWPEAHLVGVDASPQMVAEARRGHAGDAHYRFEAAAAEALSLDPESINLAFSTISFHHWTDQAGGVRQVARVLRSGGMFVLADFRPPWILRPMLRRLHDTGSRQRLFADAGLTVVTEHRPLRLGRNVLITVGRKQ